jgi:hypothetical protein
LRDFVRDVGRFGVPLLGMMNHPGYRRSTLSWQRDGKAELALEAGRRPKAC